MYKCYITVDVFKIWGFPGSSADKESTVNAGDPGLIPGLGKSPGEGLGYALQYSWASLVAQMIKNLSAMWKTWVLSLGWEDPLEGYPLQYPGLENSMDCIVRGVAKSRTRLSDFPLSDSPRACCLSSCEPKICCNTAVAFWCIGRETDSRAGPLCHRCRELTEVRLSWAPATGRMARHQ